MKAALFALSAALLPTLSLPGQTQSPYVETTTLTFYWAFADTYITNVSTPIPSLPDVVTYDPATLPSGYDTFTDTSTARPYTGPTVNFFAAAGANSQIIDMLLQRLVRSGDLVKQQLSWRWQLIAVREAPSNVNEMASNPYRVFLSGSIGGSSLTTNVEVSTFGAEPIIDDPVPGTYFSFLPDTGQTVTFDTGITITLGQHSGSYTETYAQSTTYPNQTSDPAPGAANYSWVRSASGSVATAFRVDFGAVFYDDPLHALSPSSVKRDPYNFHLKRNLWQASASGLINYGIRSVAGPLPTFVATNASATATGWFYHEHTEYAVKNGTYELQLAANQLYGGAGIAPLKVTLSTIQYQKRNLFPLSLVIPSAPIVSSTETLANDSVQVSWTDTATNETGFILERKTGLDGEWESLIRLDRNTDTFIDNGLTADTIYFYRISAFNGAGSSEVSDEISASTISAPTELDAGAISPNEIDVVWTDNSTTETGFEIQRRGPNNVWRTLDPLDPDTVKFIDDTRSSNTLYSYRVRAVDDYGASAWSNVDGATTPAPGAAAP